MHVLCSDLESVFLPELWVEVAERTGVEDLKLTTRDVSDLDVLMEKRLTALKENKIDFVKLQSIIQNCEPFKGAVDFLRWAAARMPVIILSDAFEEFVSPLLPKMNYPTVLCNSLEVDEQGAIVGYHIRPDGKRRTVAGLQEAGLKVTAMGDSYNDTKMLAQADKGFLFNASEKTARDFPQFPVIPDYEELKKELDQ
jgi:phosphoserine/homoserine phosphotransferase